MLRKYWTPAVKEEAGHIWSILWPIAISNALLMSLQITDQIFLGHLGIDELGASALGTTVYNLAFFFLAGAASACDTLIAQAFGARDYEATEYWTRMGFLVMTLLSIPAMVLFQFGEFFIRNVFRQDEHLSRMGGRYTQLLLPGLWFMCMFIVMQKSMQARNILMPSVWIMLLANAINIFGNWLFIHALKMGFDGSPLATSVSRILTCLLTAVYYYGFMSRTQPHLAQGHSYGADLQGSEPTDILPPSLGGDEGKEARERALREPLLLAADGGDGGAGATAAVTARGSENGNGSGGEAAGGSSSSSGGGKLPFRQAFWRFLALAIPGGIMVGLEAWSFDWTVTFSAQFGTEALDAHQSMMSISAFTYLTVPLAVAISATIRVGNLLGAQQPRQARLAARICIALGVSVMLLCGAVIVALKDALGMIFSPDPKVVRIVSNLCPIMALYQVFDGYQGVSSGVLRGMGRQKRVALLNLGGFWVLGLPFGALLAFVGNMGVYGIWWGFNAGLLVISVLYVIALQRIDYDAEARRALENAVTDVKLEKAWEETVEAEKEAAQHGAAEQGAAAGNGGGSSSSRNDRARQ